jgi:hypothetical protein
MYVWLDCAACLERGHTLVLSALVCTHAAHVIHHSFSSSAFCKTSAHMSMYHCINSIIRRSAAILRKFLKTCRKLHATQDWLHRSKQDQKAQWEQDTRAEASGNTRADADLGAFLLRAASRGHGEPVAADDLVCMCIRVYSNVCIHGCECRLIYVCMCVCMHILQIIYFLEACD